MNILHKTLVTLGVIGLGSVSVSPAFAGGNCCGAYASGSSAIVLMNGASQSVGAEVSLPLGTYFTGGVSVPLAGQVDGAVVVTPTLTTPGDAADPQTGLAINNQDFAELVVDPGLPDSVTALSPGASTSFTAAAAAQLDALDSTNPDELSAVVSIIRAGAGVDGLD
ncbi:hypothetical protein [Geminocystis sp. GBBB08]|uniref:hypothetical protein n=1 Tax=Geminocystis sp. GBBB08 TaxID=2604140 RepID=UPI0027E23E42|nr:hypothetical protein [Geminocystis sp. GBBB08]MBL1208375.1 hypothetical protein [Geminocystis sp. GBBB08]